ncbi:MAG: ParB N-terminal domain-containing protein [Candidatus Krumholzibacteria bacterium]|nr:ParB N-terminal domain-containing protein [Candidatus Krumholzibacteria bacterium]
MKKRLEITSFSEIVPPRDSPFCFRHSLPGRSPADEKGRAPNDPGPGRAPLKSAPNGAGADSPENRALIDSISRIGMINPPLLAPYPDPGGRMTIVAGHRRVAAAAAAGMESFEGLVVDAPLPGLVPLWLEDAASGAPLSDLEKALLAGRLIDLAGDGLGAMLPGLSAVFGREMTPEFTRRIARLPGLGASAREALHAGAVTAGDLLLLEAHPVIDAARAAEMLSAESMSRGTQKETVRLMLYLADQGRDRWESFELLRGSSGAGRPLLEELRLACRPALEKDLAEIDGIVGGLGLPTEASIRVPPNLEGGAIHLEIKIRDENRLRSALDKARRGLDEGRIGRILEILRGK